MSIARKLKTAFHRPLRAKLIFNASSGKPEESPQQLASILSEMQDQQILPEVYTVRPDSQLETVVRNAIKTGIKLIVVAGGDGTIDSVMGVMVGSDATLGIIPTGTRNNVAFNLGITGDIANAVSLLRHGRRVKVDVGRVHRGYSRHWFLEAAAVGLLSDLYPMADDFQHGNLAQIGGLLSTLISATPSRLQMILDGHKHLVTTAHMMLIANMPFLGPHFQISPKVSFKDSHLDVFTFSDMSKLNMISYAMLSQLGLVEDIGIQHYRVKHVKIRSIPHMPVLADGLLLGEGSVSIRIYPRALTVMAGSALTRQPERSERTDLKVTVYG
ncbi:MAG TPA: diacylglycerol kinase family protein [Anaerolineales bacterium]|nr:diacylglycerol kinase family protein [Anaerolineales bacterium]